MDLRQVFGCLTSFTVVCLALEAGVEMNLYEANSETGPAIGRSVNQPEIRIRRAPRPTESSEVQSYINKLFTRKNQLPSTQSALLQVPSCKNSRFCFLEDGASLDTNTCVTVDELLKTTSTDILLYNVTDKLSQTDEVGDRDHPDDPSANELCESTKELRALTWSLSDDNKWVKIAQSSKFTQKIRVEVCKFVDCECARSFKSALSSRFRSRCMQKYIYRSMVTVSEDGRELTVKNVEVPSCCSCVVVPRKSRLDGQRNSQCARSRQEAANEEGTGSRDADEGLNPCDPTSSGSRASQGLVVLVMAAVSTLCVQSSRHIHQY